MDGQTWTLLVAVFGTAATLAGLTMTAMHQLRAGLQAEIAGVRTELHATRAELVQGDVANRTEVKQEISQLRAELKGELVEVREGLARVEQRTYELALNRPAS